MDMKLVYERIVSLKHKYVTNVEESVVTCSGVIFFAWMEEIWVKDLSEDAFVMCLRHI